MILVIVVLVEVDWMVCFAPPALVGSFWSGSLRRFCAAAALRFEREIAVLSEPFTPSRQYVKVSKLSAIDLPSPCVVRLAH